MNNTWIKKNQKKKKNTMGFKNRLIKKGFGFILLVGKKGPGLIIDHILIISIKKKKVWSWCHFSTKNRDNNAFFFSKNLMPLAIHLDKNMSTLVNIMLSKWQLKKKKEKKRSQSWLIYTDIWSWRRFCVQRSCIMISSTVWSWKVSLVPIAIKSL